MGLQNEQTGDLSLALQLAYPTAALGEEDLASALSDYPMSLMATNFLSAFPQQIDDIAQYSQTAPTTSLPLPWANNAVANAVMSGMYTPAQLASLNLAACQVAQVTAAYVQYAYQMQLQQLISNSMANLGTPPQLDEESTTPPVQPIFPTAAAIDVAIPDEMKARQRHLGTMPSCVLCGCNLLGQKEALIHLESVEHQQAVVDQEQRAIIVIGMPKEATEELIQILFHEYDLPMENISYIPAIDSPESANNALSKALIDVRPRTAFWHVIFNSPEEACSAAKISEFSFCKQEVSVVLALQPQYCIVCDAVLYSLPHMADHLDTPRHKDLLRQHTARCGLSLVGVPIKVSKTQIRGLFDTCQIIEEGITIELTMKKDGTMIQTIHLVFGTEQEADFAYDICKARPAILGDNVRLLRPCGPKRDGAEMIQAAAKKAEQVRQAVCGLLRSHHIKHINAISPSLFSRIYYTYMSARPAIIPGLQPQTRFLEDFDEQAAASHGMLPLTNALAMLRPLEEEFPFVLPEGIAMWMCEKVMKYCGISQMIPISRPAFQQIRDLTCMTYQVTGKVLQNIATNEQEARQMSAFKKPTPKGGSGGRRFPMVPRPRHL